MKKYIHSILVLVLFALVGCVKTDELGGDHIRSNSVLLKINTTSGIVSRAIEDTPLEERVDWVDVFVFNADADKTVFHKERIDVSSAPVYKTGEFPLQKKRDDFDEDIPYYIYLVANASADLTSDDAGVEDWSDLQALVQVDNNLHLSAFVDGEGKPAFASAPARFLMDGFAYLTQSAESTVPPAEMGTCVVNNPDVEEIFLCGTIYRATAKFIINIKQGVNVEFQKSIYDAIDGIHKTPQYYINQLPVSTKVLPEGANEYYHPTTQNTATQGLNSYTFLWNDDNSMTIIGYGYADDWSTLEYTKQTSMVFNIPMKWHKDKSASNGREELSADNWYKIPLSKSKSFKRNTCYTIDITISTEGAEEKEYAIELKDIEYTTQPWVKTNVGIGGYDAAFLTLNTDLVKIYDTNIDTDQLTFTSSSPIKSITLKDCYAHNEQNGTFAAIGRKLLDNDGNETEKVAEADNVYAYYIDKFGQKVQLGTDPGFDIKVIEHPDWTKADILAKELNLYAKEGVKEQYIRAEIWDGQERALNGNITIHSPILPVEDNEDLNWPSHFNTVRYLEFEVENIQGIKAVFRVEQTPITIIKNIEGFFSYRDDFVVEGNVNHNPNAFSDEFGKQAPVNNGPIHFLNPKAPFFALAGFLPFHADECNENGVHLNSSCSDSYNGFEELLYGFMERIYHRSYDRGGPISGIFHRDHYMTVNDRDFISSDPSDGAKYYQAVGMCYYDEVRSKYYRRHYTGNFFETFWSKVVEKVYTEDGINPGNRPRLKGQADILKIVPSDNYDSWVRYSRPRFLVNHRMYHVRVTSTSNEYVIANPQLMDENGNPTSDRERGYTMEGEVNARVVSPSFMVASQLGESILPKDEHHYVVPGVEGIYYYAKRQCQEYVETRYEDLNGNNQYDPGEPVSHYHDWRLPTAAEIEYIIQHQDASRAMDKVLYAQYYYQASTKKGQYDLSTLVSREIPDWIYLPYLYPEEDWKEDQSYKGYYMRCVRDAYIEPEPIVYDANYNIVSGGK